MRRKRWDGACQAGGLRKNRNMPVFDAFHGRLTELVKSQVRVMNGDRAIIPATVLDIVINKPLKDNLPKRCTNWSGALTSSGKLQKPAARLPCERHRPSTGCNFPREHHQRCCTSNALHGSKDDVLWEEKVESRAREP